MFDKTEKFIDTTGMAAKRSGNHWKERNTVAIRCKGVLGIPQPHSMYYASRLSFILNVFNSDD